MSEMRKTSIKKSNKITPNIPIPPYYKVIIYEDEITPYGFIKAILEFIYYKTEEEINIISKKLYSDGKVIIGTYIKEVAITKQSLTERNAKNNNFPLSCLIEIVEVK